MGKFADDQLLTMEQAEECSGYSRNTLLKYRKLGLLPNCARWTPAQIRECLRKIPPRSQKAHERATPVGETGASTPSPKIAQPRQPIAGETAPALANPPENGPPAEDGPHAREAERPEDLDLPPGPRTPPPPLLAARDPSTPAEGVPLGSDEPEASVADEKKPPEKKAEPPEKKAEPEAAPKAPLDLFDFGPKKEPKKAPEKKPPEKAPEKKPAAERAPWGTPGAGPLDF